MHIAQVFKLWYDAFVRNRIEACGGSAAQRKEEPVLNYPMLWLVLLVAFAGVEGLTAGLISIWFCAGSLAALIASMAHASLLVQIVVFVVVSLVAMAVVRPLAKKHWQPKIQKTNVDSILGREGLVMEAIDNIRGTGQVKIGGIIWTARSEDGSSIEEGSLVLVDRVEGVKVMVSKAEKGA